MIERYHCSNKRLTFRPCQRARCPTRIPQNRAAHPKGTLLPARLPGPRCPWQPAWCPITIPRNRRCTPRGHRGLRVCQGRAVHGSWHGARSRFRGIALHMAVTAGRWRCRHHACAEGEWDRAAGPLLIGVAEAGASTQRGTHDRINPKISVRCEHSRGAADCEQTVKVSLVNVFRLVTGQRAISRGPSPLR